MNKFGLLEVDLKYILDAFTLFPSIEKAYIFGSRAMGNYKKGSDVDIAIEGKEVTFSDVANLHARLEDLSPMPYFFDIVDLNKLSNIELEKHILGEGNCIYHL